MAFDSLLNFWRVGIFSQFYPRPSKFNVDDIPDLTGKVIVVTGGNSGIGKATVKALLSKNAKVYLAARSEEKAREAIEELKGETGKEAIFLSLDLASLESVTNAANEFKQKETKLDILFNSAGVAATPIDATTADGYELQFGTNVLGSAHFTLELLPLLLSSAKLSPDRKVRIINTSSSSVYFAYKIDFDILKPNGTQTKKVAPMDLYIQSKLGNAYFSSELAKRYGDQGIVSIALNPGNIRTGLLRHLPSLGAFLAYYLINIYTPDQGAITQIWAGTSPEGADFNGKFLIPFARVGSLGLAGKNMEDPPRLWDWIEEQRKNYVK